MDGWSRMSLGDVLRLEYGKPLPKDRRSSDGAYPAFGANGEKCRTDDALCAEAGIVVGRKGSAGEVNLTDGPFWPLDVTYFVDFDRAEHDLRFLFYLLGYLDLPSLAKGVKPGLNRNDAYAITCLIPPLAEQERIVGLLDEAFAAIATATAHTERNRDNARELFENERDSTISRGGPDWSERPLGELVTIKHGYAFKSEFFTDAGDFVLLTPGNFQERGGYSDRGDKQKFYVGEIPDGFVLDEGDMLVAMTEQAPGLLGSPVIVPESHRFLHNQRLGLVQPLAGIPWHTEYFFHAFNTTAFRRPVHATSSGVKVRHTSPKKMSRVVMRYPESIADQERVARRLDALEQEAHRVATIYDQKLECLDELRQSLLHQAFTGQLTADDRETDRALAEAGV